MTQTASPNARAVTLPSEDATVALARRLAAALAPGDLVALRGDLGAGKSALCRALIRAVTEEDAEVPSPTFTLVQTYETDIGPVWHFDLYRLSGPDEVTELGWDEARAEAVLLVEWPDRLGPLLPADRLDVAMSFAGPTERRATLTGHGAWGSRLTTLDLSGLGLSGLEQP
ncbi:tRNA (adenosine(37)-N6)-threonylcarbamoyltransferase complex ATPase subunit type 1 TsaE [Azospirillum brasilense]|uniref:tRNA (adenosine(37)-N6)-threonylcarbamoyltransferase complex ATPase subunit type 1 TsaE n=1 Tax=Azospirillum brasilense TaxID=192 RepID=UPI00190B89E0|nr:tRNA (adenosine(37)-N6)-threonylcarbamoyltransferase complex ATPase subunit type 1 TsaE [Azospirillum brasilense]MBK3736378.1 tRNA (adenosine(37)-N6)-threonylcarbamoyltransferase complex ATPase subunit type 1 TsaE [Azospirillum brasilense]